LNVTPDSFSDGGSFLGVDEAVARGIAYRDLGVDAIDIGGESTRPGSEPVSAAEQKERVLPVIKALIEEGVPPISIDTTSAEVAEAAIDAGACWVNDISAFRFDPNMLDLLARTGVPAIAMHTLARPREMQRAPSYGDVVMEVRDHLEARLAACRERGVDPAQIMLDPGIGFGKTLEHNLALLRGLPKLACLGQPILVGTSRKSFLGALTGRAVDERLLGTASSCAAAIVLGAHMVRIHDVRELQDVVTVASAIAYGADHE